MVLGSASGLSSNSKYEDLRKPRRRCSFRSISSNTFFLGWFLRSYLLHLIPIIFDHVNIEFLVLKLGSFDKKKVFIVPPTFYLF